MFEAEALSQHLKTSHTVQTNAKVFAEWNMNFPDNIAKLGNYRYRPSGDQAEYKNILSNYDPTENADTQIKYYYGATDADTIFDGGYPNEEYASINPSPELFTLAKEKMGMLYSLEECVKPFRPRSGINKILYLGTTGTNNLYSQYVDNPGRDLATRPRYYVSSKYDQFKYWTSYRTETENVFGIKKTFERGVSKISVNGQSYIDDASPFVVYKNSVPANRIVVKMQTNVGTSYRGTFRVGATSIDDPLYGTQNQTTPVRWKIQVLKNNSWITAISFDESSLRKDGTPIIGADGYVEIAYGLEIPQDYENTFVFAGELLSVDTLPLTAPHGYAYLVKQGEFDQGTLYIYNAQNFDWDSFVPQYKWDFAEEFVSKNSKFASKIVDPDYFMSEGKKVYREIEIIDGIRIVVETMNRPNCTFDLIEFSPRLAVDFSDRTTNFSITKTLSDLGNSSVPVGSLFASQGSIDMVNDDFAFLDTNIFNPDTSIGSIVADYLQTKIKFNFYEIVKNVEETTGTYDYFVPIKTLYSEGVPQSSGNFDLISLQLRDAYMILESSPAPSIFLTNVSLSYAIVTLLDYIGFSNYVFKRTAGQQDPIIPYFFVAPNQNVAEVLTQLARATQSAMFFDEYNNFVVMLKEYLLPASESDRQTDTTLYGQEEYGDTIEELPGFTNKELVSLPNIISLSSNNKKVYNGGQINYTTRYIQRSYGSIQQAPYTSEYKTWIYLPSLLWEVAGTENLRTINEPAGDQASYTLAAAPLNTTLTTDVPKVENNNLINNIIDVGENVYWISKYSGYLYANGEVIKYDAMQYSISGQSQPIWISSNQEYQEYFANLPFNGKMYPTGNLRIYAEPQYETISGVTRLKNGSVNQHGRGQFGTTITTHSAGLSSYWTDNNNVYGCVMNADYIFSTSRVNNYPSPSTLLQNSPAGIEPTRAKQSSRNGVIKNMMANTMLTDGQVSKFTSAMSGTMQSSALVFSGPAFDQNVKPKNYISYISKSLSDPNNPSSYPYRHFGTRMRIIGKIESETNKAQTPIGNNEYISISPSDSSQKINISGGSGGIGIMVNPNTNNGYFYEIVALTTTNSSEYIGTNKTNVAYTIAQNKAGINSNRATIETSIDHEFIVGDKVILEGFDIEDLNGEFIIDQTTKRTFSFPLVSANATSLTGGTAKVYISSDSYLNNIIFYKIVSDSSGNAIPYKLWSGLANILVDDGKFTGQYRFAAEDNPTVYDLDIEYKDNISQLQQSQDSFNIAIGNTGNMSAPTSRTFYLYLNGKQIATVVDDNPLPKYNNVSLFVRGSSKCMFENIYALSENYSQNTTYNVLDNVADIFGTNDISANDSLRKYSVSGLVQASYLSGINSYEPPKYKMYFEEFGTIMREAAYFNIKYDRAYPALYAKISPTLNRVKGYVTSGFFAGSYGAEFLIFNCTDKTINIDATTGNYLRIQGVTFTQNTTNTLTVDEYFKKVSNLADPEISSENIVLSNPNIQKEIYDQIKISRMKYGVSEFAPIDSVYIQNEDMAQDVLGWLINRTMHPKRNVGINVFGMPTIQLGDIVTINYKKESNGNIIDMVSPETTRYIVYNIDYNKGPEDTTTTLYLSEI